VVAAVVVRMLAPAEPLWIHVVPSERRKIAASVTCEAGEGYKIMKRVVKICRSDSE
jgi:hypothetical protein